MFRERIQDEIDRRKKAEQEREAMKRKVEDLERNAADARRGNYDRWRNLIFLFILEKSVRHLCNLVRLNVRCCISKKEKKNNKKKKYSISIISFSAIENLLILGVLVFRIDVVF